MNLDHIDTRLCEELQHDGRASMESLASVVGLSRVAAGARVARLIDSGALRIIGIVHPSALGLRVAAHLSISVSGSARGTGQNIAALDSFPLVSVVAGRAAARRVRADAIAGSDAEQVTKMLLEVLEQLVQAPVELVVANHAMGLWELAALHLSHRPPQLPQAQLAIDALSALLDGLQGRLGGDEQSLRDGLAEIRMAFVQIHNAERARDASQGS